MKSDKFSLEHALIIGGSEGTGFEFARMAATEKKHLILADHTCSRLERAQGRLAELYPSSQIKTICESLSHFETADNIRDAVWFYQQLSPQNISVDLVINILELKDLGIDPEQVWEDDFLADQLDVTQLMELNQMFAAQMHKSGHRGEILNVLTGENLEDWSMELYQKMEKLLIDFSGELNKQCEPKGITVHALSYSGKGLIFYSPDATGSPSPGQASSQSMGYVQTLLSAMSP